MKHIEMWDVEPGKVLKRLLKPASKTPSSRWETFMLSVYEGDIKGVWLAASAPALKLSAPVVGVSLVTKVLTGHGLPVSLLVCMFPAARVETHRWMLLILLVQKLLFQCIQTPWLKMHLGNHLYNVQCIRFAAYCRAYFLAVLRGCHGYY